jgi:hypothetical protein
LRLLAEADEEARIDREEIAKQKERKKLEAAGAGKQLQDENSVRQKQGTNSSERVAPAHGGPLDIAHPPQPNLFVDVHSGTASNRASKPSDNQCHSESLLSRGRGIVERRRASATVSGKRSSSSQGLLGDVYEFDGVTNIAESSGKGELELFHIWHLLLSLFCVWCFMLMFVHVKNCIL